MGGGLSLRSHNPVGVRYLAPDDLKMIDDYGDLSGDYWYDDVDVVAAGAAGAAVVGIVADDNVAVVAVDDDVAAR